MAQALASPAMVIRLASLVAIAVCIARKFPFELAITIANKLLHFRGPYLLIRVAPPKWSWHSVTVTQYFGTWYLIRPSFLLRDPTASLSHHPFAFSPFRAFAIVRFPRRNRENAKWRKTERRTYCDFGHDALDSIRAVNSLRDEH